MNNFKKKIEKKIIKITNFSYANFFGRANTAIWAITLFLKKNNKKRSIILPASMCVSPAIIFLINGFKLIFVDVDKNTGSSFQMIIFIYFFLGGEGPSFVII